MLNLRKLMEKINNEELDNRGNKFSGFLCFDEPMSAHCTFKAGGKADVWVRPDKLIFPLYTAKLLKIAGEEGIPVFVLGAGANVLVSDRGFRGIVLATGSWEGTEETEKEGEGAFSVKALSGTRIDDLVDDLATRGLSGLEFLAGMPGSVGGAVWMNARCYGKSVSDALLETEILNENFEREKIPFRAEDFSCKKSPFQQREVLILSARFAVEFRESKDIFGEMEGYRQDRKEKGHYSFPSAGSAFKNNRDFNEPTGRIIDQLGLRGLSVGGAQVASWHGNFIINTGNATASDIKTLMDKITRRVKEERGFDLESEILFVGDWD
jgi:UDP-N-acetylmuramate dehydrogenase